MNHCQVRGKRVEGRVRQRTNYRQRVRLCACPGCQPQLFDGGLARVPVPVLCAIHVAGPLAELFGHELH